LMVDLDVLFILGSREGRRASCCSFITVGSLKVTVNAVDDQYWSNTSIAVMRIVIKQDNVFDNDQYLETSHSQLGNMRLCRAGRAAAACYRRRISTNPICGGED
jgi:hypothetical protein